MRALDQSIHRPPLSSGCQLSLLPVSFQIRVKPGNSQRGILLGPLPPSTCLKKWAPLSGQTKKVEKIRWGWLRGWLPTLWSA